MRYGEFLTLKLVRREHLNLGHQRMCCIKKYKTSGYKWQCRQKRNQGVLCTP